MKNSLFSGLAPGRGEGHIDRMQDLKGLE